MKIIRKIKQLLNLDNIWNYPPLRAAYGLGYQS